MKPSVFFHLVGFFMAAGGFTAVIAWFVFEGTSGLTLGASAVVMVVGLYIMTHMNRGDGR